MRYVSNIRPGYLTRAQELAVGRLPLENIYNVFSSPMQVHYSELACCGHLRTELVSQLLAHHWGSVWCSGPLDQLLQYFLKDE